MSKFFNICIFLHILNPILGEKISLSELKALVSRNDSKNWLDIMNRFENSSNPYCRLCCINIELQTIGKHCGSHTLCKYPNKQPGEACKGLIKIGFTTLDKEMILDAHNTLRNAVASGFEQRGSYGPQPSAANMRSLQWNDELAFVAERWASQCIFAHDVCRDLDRFPIGQIIDHGNFASNNELSFIKSWYDEVVYFNKTKLDNFIPHFNDEHMTKRYSQLVWADTYQIGCARAVFQQSTGFEVEYREHFICNYGPSGNIPKQPVYKIGAPCSFCHEGTSCTLEYPSLCGSETAYKYNEVAHHEKTNHKTLKKSYEVNKGSSVKLSKFFIDFLLLKSLVKLFQL